MTRQRLKHIVILGGGTAGWMTAAALRQHYRRADIDVTLIESSAIGTVGVGEATIPTIRPFYQALGLRDADVIRATGGTCKLGIQFNGWKQEGSRFIHPFGAFGHDFEGVGFHHYWQAYRAGLDVGQLDDFAIGAALAKAGKFALPNAPYTAETFNIYDWALHFDATLFAQLLSEVGRRAGVRHIDATLREVTLRPEDGHIAGLVLDNGTTVEGDLFIDCSGFAALLIGKALGVGYEDYGQWLFCDSAAVVQSERSDKPKPYTEVSARPAGWQWHIPLQHRSGNGYVFSSANTTDDEAVRVLTDTLPGETVNTPRVIKFRPGRRIKAWEKNCIAIGLASGFLEPLESTSIALIQTGIERIKQLLPVEVANPASLAVLIGEHNDMARREFERTRDFIILHYKLNQRGDTAFWRDAAAMAVPETLQHKMDLFRVRGHFVRYRWEMFHPASWLAIYAGFDVWPEVVDPAVSQLPPQVVRDHFIRIQRQIRGLVAQAPDHGLFIDYCNRMAEANYASA